jgi:hypothetical protein
VRVLTIWLDDQMQLDVPTWPALRPNRAVRKIHVAVVRQLVQLAPTFGLRPGAGLETSRVVCHHGEVVALEDQSAREYVHHVRHPGRNARDYVRRSDDGDVALVVRQASS